jgi:adenine phosphoribosyltransferase
MTLSNKLDVAIRNIPDFPKPGIQFKDITPILRDAKLCREITLALTSPFKGKKIDVVAGIESRGFLFGMLMAQELDCAFAVIRKKGKLPHRTVEIEYALEYGSAIIEMHEDEIESGQHVIIHDDLLATGGTASAAAELIKKVGGRVEAFSFLIELDFLEGANKLSPFGAPIASLQHY